MNDLTIQELSNSDVIRSRIFTIRGVQAMLDRDLAELYAKSLLIKFIRRAKKELIVIDAYPGVATLDMLAKRGRGVKIALADWQSQNVTAKTDVKEAA